MIAVTFLDLPLSLDQPTKRQEFPLEPEISPCPEILATIGLLKAPSDHLTPAHLHTGKLPPGAGQTLQSPHLTP